MLEDIPDPQTALLQSFPIPAPGNLRRPDEGEGFDSNLFCHCFAPEDLTVPIRSQHYSFGIWSYWSCTCWSLETCPAHHLAELLLRFHGYYLLHFPWQQSQLIHSGTQILKWASPLKSGRTHLELKFGFPSRKTSNAFVSLIEAREKWPGWVRYPQTVPKTILSCPTFNTKWVRFCPIGSRIHIPHLLGLFLPRNILVHIHLNKCARVINNQLLKKGS